MLYLIGKQGISYRGTQETTANSDTLLKSRKLLCNFSASYTLLSFTLCVNSFTIKKIIFQCDSSKSKWNNWYCRLIAEINYVKYRPIFADEVTNGNCEILLICKHRVDKNKQILEVILDFGNLQRITRERISQNIVKRYKEKDKDPLIFRGQI